MVFVNINKLRVLPWCATLWPSCRTKPLEILISEQIVSSRLILQKTKTVFHCKRQIALKLQETPMFVNFLQIHESKLLSLLIALYPKMKEYQAIFP